MTDYEEFLASKRIEFAPAGFAPAITNPHLKPFQKLCVERACQMGRSALFADCGLGKSIKELEFACQVGDRTGKSVIIVAPLAVAKQFEREAVKFGIDGVKACRDQSQIEDARIVVTNYQRLHLFDPADFGGIVLDESSILKSFEGSTRKSITEFARSIPFRLAATATPAPNDLIELTNHAEFLDVMTGKEIIACFFTQDGNSATKFRLKRHAEQAFWRWMSTWTTALRQPSDLGFDDDGYVLPELRVIEHTIPSVALPGQMFAMEAASLSERRQARRISLSDRVRIAAEIVAREPDEPWLIWCDLNDEADALTSLIPGSVEIRGPEDDEAKETKFMAFVDGNLKVLITKPSIAGHGLNFQHCARTIFVGLSDSFERQYQAIRRFWRFGQTRGVNVHLIASEAEGSVLSNLRRKEDQAKAMYADLVEHMAASIRQTTRDVASYDPQVEMKIPAWLQPEIAA